MNGEISGEHALYRAAGGERAGRDMGDSGQVSSSSYLIACDETERERQKELLYKVMGPVFFGQKAAENDSELAELFRSRYGD